jgi:hypothetical protein
MSSMLYYKLMCRIPSESRDLFATKVKELGFDEHGPRNGALPRCLVLFSKKKYRAMMAVLPEDDQRVLEESLKELCGFSVDAVNADSARRMSYTIAAAERDGLSVYEKYHKGRYERLKEKYPNVPRGVLNQSQAAIDAWLSKNTQEPV